MPRRMPHPAVLLIAINVPMVVGSVFVSSTVQALLVGTSWLGLTSPAEIAFSVVCSLLAMAAVTAIAFFAAWTDDGGDDGRGREDPPPMPEDPDGDDPEWWPQFQRDLDEYLSEAERSRRARETCTSEADLAVGTSQADLAVSSGR